MNGKLSYPCSGCLCDPICQNKTIQATYTECYLFAWWYNKWCEEFPSSSRNNQYFTKYTSQRWRELKKSYEGRIFGNK